MHNITFEYLKKFDSLIYLDYCKILVGMGRLLIIKA